MCNYELLTDNELLKMVVMEKEGETVVEDLVSQFNNNLADLLVGAAEEELLKIRGIGVKRVHQVKAINELAKRLYTRKYSNCSYKISMPSDVADLLIPEMRFLKKEHLIVVLLNTKNIVIQKETISIGSLNSSIVHPQQVFIPAIRKSAASIVIAHNHPSGDPQPSSEDINVTHRLKECGKLLGIDLLDHIIIGNNSYISLKEEGIL